MERSHSKFWLTVCLALPALLSCGAEPKATSEVNAIFGPDDRRDLYDARNSEAVRKAARSISLLIRTEDLVDQNKSILSRALEVSESSILLRHDKIGKALKLCPSERFREQASAGFCTGFLVAPDVMATAGHCVRTEADCASTKFIFDFALAEKGQDPTRTNPANTYQCAGILNRSLDFRNGADFALLKLDRPVTNRPVLPLRRRGSVQQGEPLLLMGHPSGLPLKVAFGGRVTEQSTVTTFFRASVDAFRGNSGSPVFNVRTGLVEGVLVRGIQDYKKTARGCLVPTQCDARCPGSDVMKATAFAHLVPVPEAKKAGRGQAGTQERRLELPFIRKHTAPAMESTGKRLVGIVDLHIDDSAGNGDGYADPGETVALDFEVAVDPQRQDFAGTFTVTSKRDDVVVEGAAEEQQFLTGSTLHLTGLSITVPETAACHDKLPLVLEINSGETYQKFHFAFVLGRPVFHEESIEVNHAIPAASTKYDTITVHHPMSWENKEVLFRAEIEHADPSDYSLSVVAPGSKHPVQLHNHSISTRVNEGRTSGIYGIDLEPFDPYPAMRIPPASGEWTFKVRDLLNDAKSGVVKKVGVIVVERQCSATDETHRLNGGAT